MVTGCLRIKLHINHHLTLVDLLGATKWGAVVLWAYSSAIGAKAPGSIPVEVKKKNTWGNQTTVDTGTEEEPSIFIDRVWLKTPIKNFK